MKDREARLYIPAFLSVALCLLLVIVASRDIKARKAQEQNKQEDSNILLKVDIDNNCNAKLNAYTNDIKTFCINEIYYLENNEISLRSALQHGLEMDDITKLLELKDIVNDNSIYEDTNNVSSNGIKIIKCKNNTYIIGNKDLVYSDTYCE